MLISTHGRGHMPTDLSPGYVMRTPDFCLPVLTPLPSTPPSQHSQHVFANQDPAVAQPASSPGAASSAIAGASLITVAFSRPTAETPGVSAAEETQRVFQQWAEKKTRCLFSCRDTCWPGPVAAPTACIAVASVEAAEVSMAPAKTLDGAPAASSAAAGLMPASAAPAKTVGHGPSTDLQLLCGAQKRAASAFAQQVHTLKQLHHVGLSTADLAAFQSVHFTTL